MCQGLRTPPPPPLWTYFVGHDGRTVNGLVDLGSSDLRTIPTSRCQCGVRRCQLAQLHAKRAAQCAQIEVRYWNSLLEVIERVALLSARRHRPRRRWRRSWHRHPSRHTPGSGRPQACVGRSILSPAGGRHSDFPLRFNRSRLPTRVRGLERRGGPELVGAVVLGAEVADEEVRATHLGVGRRPGYQPHLRQGRMYLKVPLRPIGPEWQHGRRPVHQGVALRAGHQRRWCLLRQYLRQRWHPLRA
jgi:hypothetical protein